MPPVRVVLMEEMFNSVILQKRHSTRIYSIM